MKLRKKVDQKIKNFKVLHPEQKQTISVIDRIVGADIFDDSQLYQAIYYLTDEDYADARSAILFFASKLA